MLFLGSLLILDLMLMTLLSLWTYSFNSQPHILYVNFVIFSFSLSFVSLSYLVWHFCSEICILSICHIQVVIKSFLQFVYTR